eukprot:3250636-Pleurochrysis_carterae.AAC.2
MAPTPTPTPRSMPSRKHRCARFGRFSSGSQASLLLSLAADMTLHCYDLSADAETGQERTRAHVHTRSHAHT